MYLYHLTLQPPTAIQASIVGNFSGTPKAQEIFVVRGSTGLELLRIDSATGKIKTVARLDTFSAIRSVSPFRLPGDDQDYIVVGNDSGRVTILKYDPEGGLFERIHQETFGRSGCRRTIPGQYTASDPRGRAIMVAALDRQKLIYTLNRDPMTSKLTISSPLEAPKASTLIFHCVGVDVGYENPIFACIELEYGDLDDELMSEASAKLSADEILTKSPVQKVVTFYEVDLGLNHASRKWLEAVPDSAHHLVTVPGGTDGPGGVLVCSENSISWHNQGFESVSVQFPTRSSNPDRPLMIISSSLVKAKNVFFFLLQTEEGDLFKLSIDYTADGVQGLRMRYYDTVAVASSLAVLKSGFLFVPAESSNHLVYQIQSLGDYEDEPEWDGNVTNVASYTPRALRNLAPIDQMENFAPVTAATLVNLGEEEMPQLYMAQGKGALSTFNIVRYGLGVQEVAQSELPAIPTGIWTLRSTFSDPHDSMLILSFPEGTTVLAIGESIEEVSDSGFLNDISTLAAFQLTNDSYIQVHSGGVRQISSTRGISEWRSPSSASLIRCAFNERQLVAYFDNRSLVYFELDANGNLSERKSLTELPEELTCLFLGPVPPERQRSRFLAVGSTENVVRIISLDPDDCLEPMSLQALAAQPSSLLLTSRSDMNLLNLDVGLENGVLVSLRVDILNGSLSDAQTRYIGSQPLKLGQMRVEDQSCSLLMSSRVWVKYEHQGASHLSPLFYETFEMAAAFSSEQSGSGAVLCIGNTLRIISIDNLNSLFTRHRLPITATPKRLAFHPNLNLFALAEGDCEGVRPEELARISDATGRGLEELREANISFSGNSYSSALEIIDPFKGMVLSRIQLEPDELCTCATFVEFYGNPKEHIVAIGVAKNFESTPRSAESSAIHLYRFTPKTGILDLLHKTPIEHIPSAMISFAGCLLVGVGGLLRLYDLGQKRLLRKCEARFPSFIVSLQAQGWRITVGDAHESIFYVLYRHEENQFVTFADEPQPRSVSTHCFLDYDTVAVADRYGNFCVMRLPATVSEAAETDGSALVVKRDGVFDSGNALEKLAEFYVGETIVSLQKAAFVHGAREAIYYVTVSGAIGVFIPFAQRSDALLSQNLELFMRTEEPAMLLGRDHLAFRSSYSPVKSVIDGNLCERLQSLTSDRKHMASQLLDTSPEELLRHLQAIRSSIGF